MAESMVELENKLSDLRKQFVDGIPARLANIEEQWQALNQGVDGEQRETLIRMVHSFAGSGAIYGFTRISEAARSLEKKLVKISEAGGLPTCEQSADGQSSLEALGEAIRSSMLEL